jgi:GxxExxY protein
MTENEISKIIIECAIEAHRTLGGPGLLESVYEEALVWELEQRRLKVRRQVDFPIPYKGRKLSKHFRMDVLVEELVLVDTKAVTKYDDIFEAQMLTYLRLTGLKLGMVINFGQRLLKDGIHRVVNGLVDQRPESKDAKV